MNMMSCEHNLYTHAHFRAGHDHTHISVTFSLSCGMLVIPSASRHCSIAKEHRQAAGHPPKLGEGARLSRASTRGKGSARARGAAKEPAPSATAMFKMRIFPAPAEFLSDAGVSWEVRDERVVVHCPALWQGDISAGQGLVRRHSCTEQQEGQAGRQARGLWGHGGGGGGGLQPLSFSLSPHLFQEGRGIMRGAGVTRHPRQWEWEKGGTGVKGVCWWWWWGGDGDGDLLLKWFGRSTVPKAASHGNWSKEWRLFSSTWFRAVVLSIGVHFRGGGLLIHTPTTLIFLIDDMKLWQRLRSWWSWYSRGPTPPRSSRLVNK